MPLLVLIFIFIVVPLAELYVIFKVGEAIGVPLTILLLAVDSLIGSLLLKSQGRAVWRRFSETMAAGRMPHREVLDGVMVIFGGAFLITPGFITDVVGLFLLLPPTRAIARRTARPGARRADVDRHGGGRHAPAGALGLRRRGHRDAGRRRVRAAHPAAAAVSPAPAELAVALSFFDPDAGIHGTVRSGLTLLFEGREARAERGPVEIERDGDGWQARASGDVDVEARRPASDTADLGGVAVSVCSVEGSVGGKKISGLGTAAETRRRARVARARSAARDLGRVRARAGGARGRPPPARSRGARQRAGHGRR